MYRLNILVLSLLVAALAFGGCDDDGDSSGDTDTDSDTDTDTDSDTDTDTDSDTDTDTDTDSDTDSDTATDDGLFHITTLELPYGHYLEDYSVTMETMNAQGDVTWSITAGELPTGFTHDNGVISGTANDIGEWPITVRAEDDYDSEEVELVLIVPDVLLMSGYEPFGSFTENPSWEAIKDIDMEIIGGFDVRTIEIPVTWANGWVELVAEIERLDPVVVIASGVAGTDYMRIETNGQNIMSGADNDGIQGGGGEIVEGGPATIPDGLPAQEMADAMNAAGYNAQLSTDAGTYLCNFALYNLMYYIEYEATYEIVGGFIHVPPAPTANFQIADITDAHKVGIETLAEWMESGKAASDKHPTVHTPPEYFLD